MNWINLGAIAAVVTFVVTLLSFFLAIRSEIRGNNIKFTENIIKDEKRHFTHDKRIELIEDRLNYTDSYITYRLDGITNAIEDVKSHISEHIKEAHR